MIPSTDGVEVAVHDLGGDGPTLFVSHATGFLGLMYAPLARELPQYHSVAIDYRGHGDATEPASGAFAWTGFREDALAVIDALGLGAMYGFGHSMGGTVLLMIELARPGTFHALALYEPIVYPPGRVRSEEPIDLVVGTRRRRREFPTREAAFENYSGKPPLDVLTPEVLRLYVDHGLAETPEGTVRLKCDPESEARTFEANMSHDTWARLGEVQCPVLVMAEPFRDRAPAMMAENAARRLPRGEYLVFPDLDHFGPFEDPSAVATAVSEYFARA
jgi:pimeloyl-ACP methyl ester carboxylesterase